MTRTSTPMNGEIRRAVDDMMTAFEAFKAQNDARLKQIERRGGADAVTSAQVDRLNAALDAHKSAVEEITLRAARPGLSTKTARYPSERKQAFDRYVRTGDASAIARVETKALSTDSDPDGGYVAPPELEGQIGERLKALSPIRQIATVREVGGPSFRKAIATAGPASGWAAETAARAETTSPSLSVVEFPTMELFAMPAATQSLLDDAQVDVDAWLVGEIEAEFAAQEGQAFVKGTGTDRPRGFLSYTAVADGTQTWGQLGYIASGAAGGFATASPGDALIDLIYAPNQAHRAEGRFVMNRKTAAQIRKFKDADGQYLWQPGLAGEPATLLGYPVVEAEDMDDVAAGEFPIAFGDFGRGYLIVDRVGLRVLRDPFSAKPFVLFYTTKRVGGGVQNFDAIKLLKIGAS